jgi:YD repeat-containing protein
MHHNVVHVRPARNLLATTDANGATTTRTYDALNRVTSSTATRNGSAETVTWTYDDATNGRFGVGRLATLTDPTGSTSYQYERRGLPRTELKTIASSSYTEVDAQRSHGRGAVRLKVRHGNVTY